LKLENNLFGLTSEKYSRKLVAWGRFPSVVVGEPTLGLTGEKVHQAAKLHGKALLWQSLFLLEAAMRSSEGGEVTCDKRFFKKRKEIEFSILQSFVQIYV
jgi:hypothetical protein